MRPSKLTIMVILLMLEKGTCDLCDICRRKRDSAIRMPYNQRWFFDTSLFLCQPFNFCDDEITERLKRYRSKAEISCDGMNCFDWLYQSLKKRQAQESDLPKVILKPHRYHVQINEAPDVAPPTEAAYTEQSAGEVPAHTSSTTAKSKALHPEDELIADVDGGFEYSYKKPEAVHLSLGKQLMHPKPEVCTLKPDRGRRWPCSQRWYYNVAEGLCRTFTFCGQKGNRNNFMTNSSCYEQCHDVPPTENT